MTRANGIARCRAQRELPDWLDQSIEARHADLPLAILSAFVDAQRVSAPSRRTSVPTVPREATPLYAAALLRQFRVSSKQRSRRSLATWRSFRICRKK